MADSRTVTVVPLKGMRLWQIVIGEETAPTRSESEQAKFAARRDRALATVVLSVDTSLLYLIGNPEYPVVVWRKLADQFEKKTWATRLDLRRKLHSLRLKDGDSAGEHIKVTGKRCVSARYCVGGLYCYVRLTAKSSDRIFHVNF